MQKLDEPIGHNTCRHESGKTARVLSVSAGTLVKLNKNPLSEAKI